MTQTKLPLSHFRHLNRLKELRQCSFEEAVDFLVENVDANANNWIDGRFGYFAEERSIDGRGYSAQFLMEKIQGLPRDIRPVTDGFYLKDFSFFSQDGLIGIEAEGVKLLDFADPVARDKGVFALVGDLLPPMSIIEYRAYNTFNSQYLRLVRQPTLFTMPRIKGVAIDAGCYVGYKALALAQFTQGENVLAFELASDNLEVLKKNIALNPDFRVEAIRAALSDKVTQMKIQTRNERTMAHSLTAFTDLSVADTSLLHGGYRNLDGESIETSLLDDYTKDFDRLSAVHISVNGHEPEVVAGAIETARKTDILRVSCPYSRNGRPVRDIVKQVFVDAGVQVFGISGAAVIAGQELGEYHAVAP